MKKKAIVFFADMRTTFDTSFYDGRKVNVTEKFIDFTEKISEFLPESGFSFHNYYIGIFIACIIALPFDTFFVCIIVLPPYF